MITWDQLSTRIRDEIRPGVTAILKTDAESRRPVVSNDGSVIGMRTGVRTEAEHTITYDMLKYAYEILTTRGRFDSKDFRDKFSREYADATCRYSMTGGVLVELGVAERIVTGTNRCYYRKAGKPPDS